MTTLDSLDETMLEVVADRSRQSCIVYRDHPLPTGCIPDHADIGIESPPGSTLLHVRRGLTYTGTHPDVASWLHDGTRRFDSPADAVVWLSQHLERSAVPSAPQAEAPGSSTESASAQAPSRLPVDEVTDIESVEISSPSKPPLESLRSALATEVLGQENAIEALAELAAHHVIKPFPRRPASALLVGPTGTGKTLAAERLALELTSNTGSQWAYRRVDMNEFSEKHSASRLFGAPPGYVGYGDGEDLATALRGNPNTVVLFDEIDKAHPQLWRSLMNLMDAGRLATQSGDIDARRTILLFTSNKDANAIQAVAGEPEARKRAFLRDHGYPPEIVGRMGRILVFAELPVEVTGRLLVLTVQRVVESYGLQLTQIAPEAITTLAVDAPLRNGGRDLEYHVENMLCEGLAEFVGNQDPVQIDATLAVRAKPIEK